MIINQFKSNLLVILALLLVVNLKFEILNLKNAPNHNSHRNNIQSDKILFGIGDNVGYSTNM